MTKKEILGSPSFGILYDASAQLRDPGKAMAFFDAVVNLRTALNANADKADIDSLFKEVYGVYFSDGLTPAELEILGSPSFGILYDASAQLRDPGKAMAFFDAVVNLRTALNANADKADIDSLFKEVYGVYFSDGLTPAELEILGSPSFGILYDASAQLRDPGKAMAFFDAVVNLRTALNANADKADIDSLFKEVYGVYFSDGLTPAELEILGSPSFGILYDASAQLRDPAKAMAFFDAVVNLRKALNANADKADIDSLFKEVYGVYFSDGLTATELEILGSPSFGILYDASAQLRDPAKAMAFFDAVVNLRKALNANPDKADIDSLFKEVYGVYFSDGLTATELEILWAISFGSL